MAIGKSIVKKDKKLKLLELCKRLIRDDSVTFDNLRERCNLGEVCMEKVTSESEMTLGKALSSLERLYPGVREQCLNATRNSLSETGTWFSLLNKVTWAHVPDYPLSRLAHSPSDYDLTYHKKRQHRVIAACEQAGNVKDGLIDLIDELETE